MSERKENQKFGLKPSSTLNSCVIIKAEDPVEAAHISPFSMRGEIPFSNRTSIWKALDVFWTKERVMSWYEAVYNMLCFAPQVHSYHERALFALKPGDLSSDQKCQKVQFFWLESHHHSQRVDLLCRPDLPRAPDGGPRNLRLFNMDTETKICSGQEIDLTTSDPIRLPLKMWVS